MTAVRMTQHVVMTTLWMTLRDDRGADDTTCCDDHFVDDTFHVMTDSDDLLRRMTAEPMTHFM